MTNETGTNVPPTEGAIVSEANHLTLLLPSDGEDTRVVAYLRACFVRLHIDPEFVETQLAWLDDIESEPSDAAPIN